MRPKIRDHIFVPGSVLYGEERECSVPAPVREDGQWVSVHCGYCPEEHIQTTDPIHSVDCPRRNGGLGACCCWVSGRGVPTPPATGEGGDGNG